MTEEDLRREVRRMLRAMYIAPADKARVDAVKIHTRWVKSESVWSTQVRFTEGRLPPFDIGHGGSGSTGVDSLRDLRDRVEIALRLHVDQCMKSIPSR